MDFPGSLRRIRMSRTWEGGCTGHLLFSLWYPFFILLHLALSPTIFYWQITSTGTSTLEPLVGFKPREVLVEVWKGASEVGAFIPLFPSLRSQGRLAASFNQEAQFLSAGPPHTALSATGLHKLLPPSSLQLGASSGTIYC